MHMKEPPSLQEQASSPRSSLPTGERKGIGDACKSRAGGVRLGAHVREGEGQREGGRQRQGRIATELAARGFESC